MPFVKRRVRNIQWRGVRTNFTHSYTIKLLICIEFYAVSYLEGGRVICEAKNRKNNHIVLRTVWDAYIYYIYLH